MLFTVPPLGGSELILRPDSAACFARNSCCCLESSNKVGAVFARYLWIIGVGLLETMDGLMFYDKIRIETVTIINIKVLIKVAPISLFNGGGVESN